jgi:hypothetical protein
MAQATARQLNTPLARRQLTQAPMRSPTDTGIPLAALTTLPGMAAPAGTAVDGTAEPGTVATSTTAIFMTAISMGIRCLSTASHAAALDSPLDSVLASALDSVLAGVAGAPGVLSGAGRLIRILTGPPRGGGGATTILRRTSTRIPIRPITATYRITTRRTSAISTQSSAIPLLRCTHFHQTNRWRQLFWLCELKTRPAQ